MRTACFHIWENQKKKSVMVSQLYRRKVKNLVVLSFMKKIMRAEKKIDEIGFWAYFDQKVNESNMVYPPKGDAKHIQLGSYCFYLCFIPQREIRSISLGVQLILFPFIGVSKCLELFTNLYGFSIFFLLQMFYPPKGDT